MQELTGVKSRAVHVGKYSIGSDLIMTAEHVHKVFWLRNSVCQCEFFSPVFIEQT